MKRGAPSLSTNTWVPWKASILLMERVRLQTAIMIDHGRRKWKEGKSRKCIGLQSKRGYENNVLLFYFIQPAQQQLLLLLLLHG